MKQLIYNKETQNYKLDYKCKGCGKKQTVGISSPRFAKFHKERCISCASQVHSKPISFKNLITGEVKRASSITKFCNQLRLGENAKFHFAEVLKGKRLHYKGWGLNIGWIVDQDEVKEVKQLLIKRATE